jgi:hypothetical protein
MPITFDSLEDLKAFCREFGVKAEKPETVATVAPVLLEMEAPKVRKPRVLKAELAQAPATKPERTRRPKGEETLTAKIQRIIQQFIDKRKEFTANDVYGQLVQKEPGVNKQSVITSVLKQMNSHFKNISFEERPGAGPRNVKVYMP